MLSGSPSEVLWMPPDSAFTESGLARYQGWLQQQIGHRFGNYTELYHWSVSDLDAFWKSVAEFFDVRFQTPPKSILADRAMPGARWFPGATLNFAEHLLRLRPEIEERTAILYRGEPDEQGVPPRVTLSRLALRAQVAAVASHLRALGVTAGDRVAGYLTNRPESVVAFLAAASLGVIWSSCPPELSSKGVLDRLSQIEPKVLIAVDTYRYGGKVLDRSESLQEIIAGLPSLTGVILVGTARQDRVAGPSRSGRRAKARATDLWDEIVTKPADDLHFEPVPFDHPLWILYSSGTTGKPKPIVHGHGGMLLEHLKALGLHLDLREGDRFFWFTTAGWMMWNFLVSGLGLGTTIILYDGSPKYPDLSVLWRFAAEERITYFGTSAPFLLACRKAQLHPRASVDLSALRSIGSTGAPLPAEGFRWVYENVKPDVWLGSASGGTDVCTAFILSNPQLPVRAGRLQCRGLGAPIEAWDIDGRAVWDEVGELVLTAPMPCMPVKFWNDPDGERFRASYFDHYPGIWRHGDWLEISARDGQCVIYGRSDSTLNRAGIRLGTSEFYRIVEQAPEVEEALVIDTTGIRPDGTEAPGKLLLFIVLRGSAVLDDRLKKDLCQLIRSELSPRYVPDAIFPVPAIPHTLNAKKLEVPIKRVFQGVALTKAVSREAVAEPDVLDYFASLASRQIGQSWGIGPS
jgi:acetoacetyl-CoA synthetase